MEFIDFHCDTVTTAIERRAGIEKNDLDIDFKRLEACGNCVQFFAVWLDDKYLDSPFKNTVKFIEFFKKEIGKTKCRISSAESYSDIIYNRNRGYGSALLAVEGGEAIENDLDNIHILKELGVRIFTLTWNRPNLLGCGALGGEGGLTPFGKSAVSELEKAGVFADVSHLNDEGFRDVCRISEKPFIASHSNSRSICPVPRNLTDDQIKEISARDGIIGLNLFSEFIRNDAEPSCEDVLRHIDHIIEVGGEDVIGLGRDYDGIASAPKGLENIDSSKFLYELIEKHFGESIAMKVFYSNADRFLQKNL